jgi:hypothetical protein
MESKIPTREVKITHSNALGYSIRLYGSNTGALIKEFFAEDLELPEGEQFEGGTLEIGGVGNVNYSDNYDTVTVNLA